MGTWGNVLKKSPSPCNTCNSHVIIPICVLINHINMHTRTHTHTLSHSHTHTHTHTHTQYPFVSCFESKNNIETQSNTLYIQNRCETFSFHHVFYLNSCFNASLCLFLQSPHNTRHASPFTSTDFISFRLTEWLVASKSGRYCLLPPLY